MADISPTGSEAPLSSQVGETTGRFVVTFSDEVHGDQGAVTEALQSMAGVSSVASTLDYDSGAVDVDEADAADATVFAELGVAVVSADPTEAGALNELAATDARIVAVEPERILYAIDDIPPSSSLEYVRGYRDAAAHLYEQLAGANTGQAEADVAAGGYLDNASFTWGLQAIRAATSTRTGQGVPVAILDTGMDLAHPDFAGRSITPKSFVSGQTAQDGHGHGTHCVGTSCGSKSPSGSRRYGVATGAKIFVGKVLSNQGSGSDSGILAGMNWAIANGVRVISMSLGADVRQVSTAYETVGRRALAAGTLIVAAAGNNARRSLGNNGFVGMPAQSLHHGRRRHRRQSAHRRLLRPQQPRSGWQGRHRRARSGLLFLLAHAHPLQDHLRHEHGHATRSRRRRPVEPGHRRQGRRALDQGHPGGPSAEPALDRCRGRVGPGAPVAVGSPPPPGRAPQ